MPFLVLSQRRCHCLDLAAKQNEQWDFLVRVGVGAHEQLKVSQFKLVHKAKQGKQQRRARGECIGRTIDVRVKISKYKLPIKHCLLSEDMSNIVLCRSGKLNRLESGG